MVEHMHMPADTSARRRPVMVTLLTVVCFLTVIYLAYLGYDTWLYAQANPPGFANPQVRNDLLRSVLLVPILGVLGIGLWQMRRWARRLAMVLLVITIASSFATSLVRYPLGTGLLVGINRNIVSVALLLFFLHPVTRVSFEGRQGMRAGEEQRDAGSE